MWILVKIFEQKTLSNFVNICEDLKTFVLDNLSQTFVNNCQYLLVFIQFCEYLGKFGKMAQSGSFEGMGSPLTLSICIFDTFPIGVFSSPWKGGRLELFSLTPSLASIWMPGFGGFSGLTAVAACLSPPPPRYVPDNQCFLYPHCQLLGPF